MFLLIIYYSIYFLLLVLSTLQFSNYNITHACYVYIFITNNAYAQIVSNHMFWSQNG